MKTRTWITRLVVLGALGVAAAVVPPLVDWWEGDRELDPVRYTGLRLLDDLASRSALFKFKLILAGASSSLIEPFCPSALDPLSPNT